MNAPAPRSNVLKGTQISCMLPVIDLERARRFYGEQLGLEAVGAKASGKFVYRCGGTEVALFPKPGGTKATHSTLSFQVKDIVAAIRALEARGVVFADYDLPGFKTVDHIAGAEVEALRRVRRRAAAGRSGASRAVTKVSRGKLRSESERV